MKRFLFIFACILFTMGCQFFCRDKSIEGFRQLPNVDILLSDSNTICNLTKLEKDKPVVLFYFSPDCEYCRDETRYLVKNKESLKTVNVVFVSNASVGDIRKFKDTFKLDAWPEVTIGTDYRYELFNAFNFNSLPDFVIYNRDRELVAYYKGEVDMEVIGRAINR